MAVESIVPREVMILISSNPYIVDISSLYIMSKIVST